MKNIMIILFLSFLSALIYYLTRKYHSKLVPAGIIFILSTFVGYLVPLTISNENLLQLIITNITPAMIFLYTLNFDINNLLKNKIGCSCKMGTKKYWQLFLLAIIVSFSTQFLSSSFYDHYQFYITNILAFLIGYIASFTKLKQFNGSEDIATTMFYLLSAVVGLHLF